MENDEKELSPQESLQLIESMINTAKNRFSENGHLYVVWGWTVFVCSLSQFVLLHVFKYPQHYIVWYFSMAIFVYTLFYIGLRHKQVKVRTYADTIVGYVWLTFVIVMFLVGFLIGRLSPGQYYLYITHLILAIYGIPIFLCGIVLQFRPLIIGGIGCWLLCIISLFITDYDYQFLMIPVAMVVAWLIPGYLLRARHKAIIK
jgi:hypothetical protein